MKIVLEFELQSPSKRLPDKKDVLFTIILQQEGNCFDGLGFMLYLGNNMGKAFTDQGDGIRNQSLIHITQEVYIPA